VKGYLVAARSTGRTYDLGRRRDVGDAPGGSEKWADSRRRSCGSPRWRTKPPGKPAARSNCSKRRRLFPPPCVGGGVLSPRPISLGQPRRLRHPAEPKRLSFTRLVEAAVGVDRRAADDLPPAVYDELLSSPPLAWARRSAGRRSSRPRVSTRRIVGWSLPRRSTQAGGAAADSIAGSRWLNASSFFSFCSRASRSDRC
jgi:hypothetical protein